MVDLWRMFWNVRSLQIITGMGIKASFLLKSFVVCVVGLICVRLCVCADVRQSCVCVVAGGWWVNNGWVLTVYEMLFVKNLFPRVLG